MQLRDPEALRVLHQHHRRIGHIHAHLNHCRRYQYIHLTGRKLAHRLLLLLGAHLAVQQHQLVALQLSVGQALKLGGRGAQIALTWGSAGPRGLRLRLRLLRIRLRLCFCLLHQRAHHVCLSPRLQLLAQVLIGTCARALTDNQACSDRPAPMGQLAQGRHVEIAMF